MKDKTLLRKSITIALTTSFLLSVGPNAFAAEIPSAGSVLRDTQQSERKLPERQAPNVTVEDTLKPPMVNDQSFKVFVKSYQIIDQDQFNQAEPAGLLTVYTNKEMTMSSLQEACEVVAKYFRNKGFFVAQAYLPQQEIVDGKVQIAVIVGHYGEMIIKNGTPVADDVIKRQLSTIRPGAEIRIKEMERAALLAGDLTGVEVKTTLTPGKAAGSADVIVEVSPKGKDLQGYFNVDNYGSRLTGYNRGTLNLNYGDPFKQGDKLSANVSRTNLGEYTGDIGYQLPVTEGSTFNLRYSKVNYTIGEEFADLNIHGTAYTKHADWTYALQRSRASNQYIQLGYDHKTMQDIAGASNVQSNKNAHIISLRLSGDNNDNWGRGGANSYSLLYCKGSAGGDSNDPGTTLITGSWTKYTYSFLRQQYLNDRLSLVVSLSGQLAGDNLDSSEKFVLGGPNAVRAYPVGEAAGDEAYLATGELRYLIPANSKGGLWQLAAFYDTGVSHIEKYSSDPDNRRYLSGVGLSAQYVIPSGYAIKLTCAWRTGREESQADTRFGSSHLWLQAIKYF